MLALDDRLFVGSTDNFFYCLSADDGRWDWRWRTGGDIVGLPVVDARNVYFVSLDNVLRALSRKSGVQQWVRPLPIRPVRGPIMAGSALVVTGIAPTLRAYKLSDGLPAGEMVTAGELAAPVYALPASPLPTLVVVTRDLEHGALATLIVRNIEPTIGPIVALPNPIKMAPLAEVVTPSASRRAPQ
jgi:hypothetical protein